MNHPSSHRVTRRGVLTLAGVATVGVTACGSEDLGSGSSGGEAKMRTVTSSMGKVEVPAKPQRIVLLSATSLLEIPDIPVVGPADDPHYIGTIDDDVREVYDGIKKLGSAEELDLAKIAPTVYVGPKEPNDRLDQYPQLADAINEKKAAEKVIGDTKEYGKEIASSHADLLKGKTAMAVVAWEDSGEVSIGHSADWDALVPQMAGITFKKSTKYGGTMSHERAARELEKADLIVIGGANRQGKLPESTSSFTESRLFRQLPAVTAKRVITTREGGDRSWTVARENLEIIEKALDGMS